MARLQSARKDKSSACGCASEPPLRRSAHGDASMQAKDPERSAARLPSGISAYVPPGSDAGRVARIVWRFARIAGCIIRIHLQIAHLWDLLLSRADAATARTPTTCAQRTLVLHGVTMTVVNAVHGGGIGRHGRGRARWDRTRVA